MLQLEVPEAVDIRRRQQVSQATFGILTGTCFSFTCPGLSTYGRKLGGRPAMYTWLQISLFALGFCKGHLADRNMGRRYDLLVGRFAWVAQ